MRITFLKGSVEDIARNYAQQNKNNRNIDYFLSLTGNFQNKYSIISKSIFHIFSLYISKKFTSDYYNLIKIFAKELKKNKYSFFNAVCFPDLMSYFFARFSRLAIPHMQLGCSSVILKDKNGLIHGRNLDFFGGNYFSSKPEILVFAPDGYLKSINILSEGIFFPGISSMNEAGLSISVHLLFSKKVNLKGEPILNILFKIVNTCQNINDVEKILKKTKAIAGWGLVICDHTRKEFSIFELNGESYNRVDISPNKKYLAYNNMYLSELKNSEFLPNYIWIQNNYTRNKRLKYLLSRKKHFCDILSDQFDNLIEQENGIGGHFIANNFTISSVVFDTIADKLFVSENSVPASIGKYKIFRLSSIFKEKEDLLGEYKTLKNSNLVLIKELVDGYDGYIVSGNINKMINILKELLKKYNDVTIKLFLAVLYLKIKNFRESIVIVDEIIDSYKDNYRKGMLLLLKAIGHDFLNERSKALQIYKTILKNYIYPDLMYFVLKFIEKKVNESILKRIDINLFLSFFVIL